eukprot:TRINITY_DN9853_c0_g1_i7.p1 TRINITY_DN9853_c0_g1~~TRINITY_DN9853_c0_g1_i7.p1  ORF type:complete len:186 (-),score=52.90 TRINITY_DN9853_c0_g1_i7:191-748(-)
MSAQLRKNLQDQLNRLVQQLEDLEKEKDSLEPLEYEELRKETLDEMKVFEEQMERMISGDTTLVGEFQAAKLALRAAVSQAFRTPEVIRMFANQNNGQLRKRLEQLQRDVTLGKQSEADVLQEKLEILSALKKLGENLKDNESGFLRTHLSGDLEAFESASGGLGVSSKTSLLTSAAASVQNART